MSETTKFAFPLELNWKLWIVPFSADSPGALFALGNERLSKPTASKDWNAPKTTEFRSECGSTVGTESEKRCSCPTIMECGPRLHNT